MSKRFKKYLAYLGLLLFLASIIAPVIASANPLYTQYSQNMSKADIRTTIINKLSVYMRNSVSFGDMNGLVLTLNNMSSSVMWVYYAQLANTTPNATNPVVDIEKPLMDTYNSYISNLVTQYNDTYKDGDEFSGIFKELDVASGDITIEKVKLIISNTATVYTNILNDIAKDWTDDNKEKKKIDNAGVLKAIYSSIQNISQVDNTLTNLQVNGDLGDSGATDATSTLHIPFTVDTAELMEIYNSPDAKIKELMDYGREQYENAINTNISIKVSEGENILDKFTEVTDKKEVNKAYLAAFSASSIYRPFDSIAGEPAFIKALQYLTKEEDKVVGGVVSSYNTIKSRKKPLYHREHGMIGGPSKEAKRITVKDLLDLVEDDKAGYLVTFTGKFTRGEDGESWESHAHSGNAINQDEQTGQVITNPNNNPTTPPNNPTTPPTTDESQGNNSATIEDDKGQIITIGDSITDETRMTDPILIYGPKTEKGSLTSLIINNMITDNKKYKNIPNLNSRFLYMNPFGDIVLDDDTIVLPGASNPAYYNDDSSLTYFSGTAAFANHYPRIDLATDTFTTGERQKGKYIVANFKSMDNKYDGSYDDSIKSRGPYTNDTLDLSYETLKLSGDNLTTMSVANKCMPIEMSLFNGDSSRIPLFSSQKFNLGFWDNLMHSGGIPFLPSASGRDSMKFIVFNPTTIDLSSPVGLYPLVSNNTASDGFIERSKFIAQRTFEAFTVDSSGMAMKYNNRLNIDIITKSVLLEGYNGSGNIGQFVKNSIKDYEDLSNSGMGKITRTIRDFAQKTMDTFGQSAGIVGIQNAYQDPIFGKFLYYCNEYIFFFLVAVAVYFVIKYSMKRTNIIYATLAIVSSIIFTYVFLLIIPVYLPSLLNGAINSTAENMGYQSLFMKQELYKNPWQDKTGYDADGNFTLSNSVTLYKLNNAQMSLLSQNYDIDMYKLLSGTAYVLDADAGIYVEGNSIKINLERMLGAVTISGEYESTGGANIYTLKSKKTVYNPVDYYTPYYLIIDGFIEKLNITSKIFRIPPSPLQYPNGLYKDSFLVDAFIRSDLFLNGENLNKVLSAYEPNVRAQIQENFEYSTEGEKTIIHNLDFMGLTKVFDIESNENKDSIRSSLWYQTMKAEGYYNEDDTNNEEKLSELIAYMNRHARNFLLENEKQLKFISDENIIKIVSMYALVSMNPKVSNFFNVMYPQALNYEELKLEDVLLPTLTKEYDLYMASNQNLVSYVAVTQGAMGLIMLIALIVISFLITNIMKFGLPILYILLLMVILMRLTMSRFDNVKTAFKGYLKVFGILFACYSLSGIIMLGVNGIPSGIWALTLLLMSFSIILSVMVSVLAALLGNITDFGNTNVNSMISKFATRLRIPRIDIGNLIGGMRNPRPQPGGDGIEYDPFGKYGFDSGVDGKYDEEIMERVYERRHSNFRSSVTRSGTKSRRTGDGRRVDYDMYDADDIGDEFDKYKM